MDNNDPQYGPPFGLIPTLFLPAILLIVGKPIVKYLHERDMKNFAIYKFFSDFNDSTYKIYTKKITRDKSIIMDLNRDGLEDIVKVRYDSTGFEYPSSMCFVKEVHFRNTDSTYRIATSDEINDIFSEPPLLK